MGLPLIPPAIALGSALVRQASLYLGKRAAEKLAKEGSKKALEAAAKKASNKSVKEMAKKRSLGKNAAPKPKKEPLTMGARVKRAIKPLDAGNKRINNAIKKTATNDKTAIKFGLGGVGLGAAANEVYSRVKGADKIAPKSFGDTFSQARKDGSKTFMYKGDKYTTKLAKPKKK